MNVFKVDYQRRQLCLKKEEIQEDFDRCLQPTIVKFNASAFPRLIESFKKIELVVNDHRQQELARLEKGNSAVAL